MVGNATLAAHRHDVLLDRLTEVVELGRDELGELVQVRAEGLERLTAGDGLAADDTQFVPFDEPGAARTIRARSDAVAVVEPGAGDVFAHADAVELDHLELGVTADGEEAGQAETLLLELVDPLVEMRHAAGDPLLDRNFGLERHDVRESRSCGTGQDLEVPYPCVSILR